MKKVVILFVLALGAVRAASASAGLVTFPVDAEEAPSTSEAIFASADVPLEEAEEQTYTVQRGDRLNEVAAQYGLIEEELLAANPRAAFGVSCGKPHKIELRDGTVRFVCGRPRFYLIAGKTLVIPVSPLVLEIENAQMNDEVAALRAEMEELRQKLETGKTAITELEQERDNLRNENKTLVAAKAELQGKYSESQSDFVVVSSRQPKQVEVRKANYTHIVLASAITAFFAVLVIFFILYRKGEKEKKFDHLVLLVQPSILAQAEKNKQRGAELDRQAKKLEEQKSATDELQTQLQKQKSEQERLGSGLTAREQTLAQGQTDLATAKRAAEGRETFCTRREGEIQEAERGLLERNEAFRKHVQTENERLRTESEAVARGKEELATAGRDLDIKKAAVDASLRTAAEDLPGMQRDREQIVEYAQDLVAREEDVIRREAEVARREEDARKYAAEAARQKEEAERRIEVASDAERVLSGRKRDVEEHEADLDKGRDELARRERELAEQLTAAQHTLDVAGGFEKAQNTISRAKRKEAIVEALDAREQTLKDWEDRLADREGLPRIRGPHRPTLSPPPLSLPSVIPPGASADDDDKNPTVTFQPPTGEEIDPRAATYLEIAPGPTTPIDSVDIVGGASSGSSPPEELQPAATPAPESPTSEAGESSSPSCEPGEVYCKKCKQGFPVDVYAAEHAGHDEGLTSGGEKSN
jgi:hypothetical protein